MTTLTESTKNLIPNLLKLVIERFYLKAMEDILIGYHFTRLQALKSCAPVQFNQHLERIMKFWQLQLYPALDLKLSPFNPPVPAEQHFQLLKTHLPMKLKLGELNRWLILFKQEIDEALNELQISATEQAIIKKHWELSLKQFKEIFILHLISVTPNI